VPKDSEPRVLMGAIAKAHGIRGQVIVKWFGEDPEAVGRYETYEDEPGKRTFRVVSARPHKGDSVLVQFADVTSRNDAEALRGTELFVPRSQLAPTEAGEFYLVDLVGLPARDASGDTVGTVTAMHNFGAGDVMEVAPADGGDTVMLPFTDDFVPDVVPGDHVVVAFPEEDADQ